MTNKANYDKIIKGKQLDYHKDEEHDEQHDEQHDELTDKELDKLMDELQGQEVDGGKRRKTRKQRKRRHNYNMAKSMTITPRKHSTRRRTLHSALAG